MMIMIVIVLLDDDDDSVDDSFVGVVHNLVDQPGRSSDGRQVRLLSEGTVVLQL